MSGKKADLYLQPFWLFTVSTKLELRETVSSSNNANNAFDQNPPTMSEVRDTSIMNINHGGKNSFTQ